MDIEFVVAGAATPPKTAHALVVFEGQTLAGAATASLESATGAEYQPRPLLKYRSESNHPGWLNFQMVDGGNENGCGRQCGVPVALVGHKSGNDAAVGRRRGLIDWR